MPELRAKDDMMAKFLITYVGDGMSQDPKAMAQAKAAFGAWLQTAGEAVVDPGAPVMTVAQVAATKPAPEAEIGGYSIIEVDDLDAAKELLSTHPFVGRGGTLQVSEFVAV
jgi:hypothetical protein